MQTKSKKCVRPLNSVCGSCDNVYLPTLCIMVSFLHFRFYGREDIRAWHMLGGTVEQPHECEELYEVRTLRYCVYDCIIFYDVKPLLVFYSVSLSLLQIYMYTACMWYFYAQM